MLCKYRDGWQFLANTKRVLLFAREDLRIPLLDERPRPHAALLTMTNKNRRRLPKEIRTIQEEVGNPGKSGLTRPSISTWATECVTVKNKDGILRVCHEYPAITFGDRQW